MYENEYLFFSRFSTFRSKTKDDEGRNDPREGNLKNIQLNQLEARIAESSKLIFDSKKTKMFNAQYNEFPTEIPGNICSLSIGELSNQNTIDGVDEKMFQKFNAALVILHPSFYDILDSSLGSLKIEYSRRQIFYYNYKEFDGELTFFHKEDSFSFQKEYRILLHTKGDEDLKIPLPGLKKISTTIEKME